jgi:hypothetical protein
VASLKVNHSALVPLVPYSALVPHHHLVTYLSASCICATCALLKAVMALN